MKKRLLTKGDYVAIAFVTFLVVLLMVYLLAPLVLEKWCASLQKDISSIETKESEIGQEIIESLGEISVEGEFLLMPDGKDFHLYMSKAEDAEYVIEIQCPHCHQRLDLNSLCNGIPFPHREECVSNSLSRQEQWKAGIKKTVELRQELRELLSKLPALFEKRKPIALKKKFLEGLLNSFLMKKHPVPLMRGWGK